MPFSHPHVLRGRLCEVALISVRAGFLNHRQEGVAVTETARDGAAECAPTSAGVWNYLAGGRHFTDADREVADSIVRLDPALAVTARTSQAFRARVVRHLVGSEGVRQFLDVGAGFPLASGNTHEIASHADPECRALYIDNDPEVLTRGNEMPGAPYRAGDLRHPSEIVETAGEVLDIDRPVALLLMGVLGHFQDVDEAARSVGLIMARLAPGSFLVNYDTTASDAARASAGSYNTRVATPYHVRTPADIEKVFQGLDLLPPGIVRITLWRPEPGAEQTLVDAYGGVGRKP
jgi:hypothetical protein